LPGPPARPPLFKRIWQSIVLRGPVVPRTDRDRAFVTIHTLLLHLRPVKVPARTIRLTHTFGLGGSSLVLVAILACTGLLMTLVYQPAPAAAYGSILTLENAVAFGPLVRGVHYWSANLLVVVLVLHAARVFLTGGYHGARQFNWVVGVSLAGVILVNAFTGYLLPWDQLSFWAVTISTGMLGYVPAIGPTLLRIARSGVDIGADTLIVFYTIHTSIVPALLVVLMAFHFWRVRKAGGVIVPPARPGATGEAEPAAVMFLPHLFVREVSLALVITAVVVVLGAALGAPLGAPANPGMSPNPTKAPWYFLGFQELLVQFHPVVAVLVLPVAGVLALLLLPYLTSDDEPSGAWFLSRRGRRAAGICAAVALVATPLAVLVHDIATRNGRGASTWLTGGVLPLVIVGGAAYALLRATATRLGLSRNEVVQSALVLAFVSFSVLTMVGVWFRGPGMALVWPWAR